MRFNSRELSCLARQNSDRFDKEGVLFAKERQEGIFRKSEVYVERLFRLRGNLLFYFKTKDISSDVLGVFVLERCVVQLDDDDEDDSYYSFIIVFEGDDRVIRLATQVESDRDGWIGSLHVASYECMKIQLQSLREQLRSRTGKDPFASQDNADSSQASEITDGVEDPFLTMCLMCRGLPMETSGRNPDTFASVHYMLPPPDERWVTHAHTEIVEKSCNPLYVAMIGFKNPQAFSIATRIKVTIYNVKERMTNTMTQIGSIIFNLADIFEAQGNRISLKLCAFDYSDVGSVIVTAWQGDSSFRLSSWSGESLVSPSDRQSGGGVCVRPSSQKNGIGLVSCQRRQNVTLLKLYFSNLICKTFRFPVNSSPDHQLFVYEYMGEGRLTYILPRQLLKLFVEEEKNEIEKLQSLGMYCKSLHQLLRIEERVELSMLNERMYAQSLLYLCDISGTTFKPSVKKAHKEVEFAPTNLHLQRMTAYNSERDATRSYDIITVGAFTAGALKYRHGGLRRMIQQLEQRSSHISKGNKTCLAALVEVLTEMDVLQSATNAACDQACTAAVQGKADVLTAAMIELENKGRRLFKVCECDLITECVGEYSSARLSTVSAGSGSSGSPKLPQRDASFRSGSKSARLPSTDTWRWSGTDFVKSPTEEPWDMTRLNVEAAVVCAISKVEELVKQPSEQAVSWLDGLSPLIIKLKRCIEVMCSRAKSGLAFSSIKDCSPNLPLVHSINYRRDVVFSQAVTAAATGFLVGLVTSDEATVHQMLNVGVLLQFENLLSCHGDEMAMLEDMSVGISDLSKVVFVLERASRDANEDALVPSISGDRSEFVVTVPVPEFIFENLKLEDVARRVIRVVPVMFSIGINEQATLAERFGDVSLQETLNLENYHRLHAYYERYAEFIKESSSGTPSLASSSLLNLENQIRHLHMSVVAKRNKNVDVLHQAAEICRLLHGVRFTSCKSAKDRTAMAVTLEQVQLLQRENDLAADVFFHVLGSLRSEGVRRENTVKNSGVRKYAFNSIQLLSLPKLYRPPNGTYGNYET